MGEARRAYGAPTQASACNINARLCTTDLKQPSFPSVPDRHITRRRNGFQHLEQNLICILTGKANLNPAHAEQCVPCSLSPILTCGHKRDEVHTNGFCLQVFCMATTKAWHTKQAGYISEDFSKLLDGIQRLVPVGLQRKIQLSYK